MARLLHGGNDLAAVYIFIVVSHHHAVFQQIDIALLYASQVRNTFLHSCLAGRTSHACDIVLFLHI